MGGRAFSRFPIGYCTTFVQKLEQNPTSPYPMSCLDHVYKDMGLFGLDTCLTLKNIRRNYARKKRKRKLIPKIVTIARMQYLINVDNTASHMLWGNNRY